MPSFHNDESSEPVVTTDQTALDKLNACIANLFAAEEKEDLKNKKKEVSVHPLSVNAILDSMETGPNGSENPLELLAMVAEAVHDVEVLKKKPIPWLKLSIKEKRGLVVRKKKSMKTVKTEKKVTKQRIENGKS